MYKAVTKEGPRAPLFCLGVALLIAASGTAAQTVERSDLALCASLETSELKLACFEVLTASEGRGAPPAADAAAEPLAASATTEKEIIPSGTVAGSGVERVAPAPAAVAEEDQIDVADDFGLEHLDEAQDVEKEEPLVRATVSEVVKGGYDVLYFHFANGQVWRQIESHRFSYPRKGEFDVIINTGMMGDYRLRLETGGPMIRIRRVK